MKARNTSFPWAVFPAALLAAILAAPQTANAQDDVQWVNHSPEERLVAKQIDVPGGAIVAHAGLLIYPQILKPLFNPPMVLSDICGGQST